MRELERDLPATATAQAPALPEALMIVGPGRAGSSIAAAARHAGLDVRLLGHDDTPAAPPLRRPGLSAGSQAVLLCVPDAAIRQACERLAPELTPGTPVGHVSGGLSLAVLSAAGDRGCPTFSLHPLQTIPSPETDLAGAPCAIAGSDAEALACARELASSLGMKPFEVPEEARAAYHAAACMASNFLVALEESATGLLGAAGIASPRDALAPLVLRTAANWADAGEAALTGPIARGDEATVEAHLAALRERAPELAPLYQVLAERTRALATQAADTVTTRPRILRTKAELRAALKPARGAGRTIALVPTMGSLHAGHLSLLAAARERCDIVVMSLFVNPSQFGAGEDIGSYPRDEARDLRLAGEAGVDLVYAPAPEEVYPDGYCTHVAVEGLTDVLCGEPSRRGAEHFRGVTTVVAKLLSTVAPNHVFFGQKDAQQAIVVRRMVRDLDIPVEVAVLPTVREPSGLAMSSRNAYLDAGERDRATSLHHALEAARAAAEAGREPGAALAASREILDAAGVAPEYLEARYADDLATAQRFNGRPVLVAVAARVGRARLIDNVVVGATDPPG